MGGGEEEERGGGRGSNGRDGSTSGQATGVQEYSGIAAARRDRHQGNRGGGTWMLDGCHD